MKNLFFLLLGIHLTLIAGAQHFQGKVIYTLAYHSKQPGVTDERLTAMMGAQQTYYYKNGQYRSEADGTLFQWQVYVRNDKRLYTKLSTSDTVLWTDARNASEKVLSREVNPRAAEVLGYACDELVLTTASATYKYYFHKGILGVDANAFKDHQYGFWYEFLSLSGTLPLKMVVDTPQFSFESTASEISPETVEDSIFVLPGKLHTAKSPF